jgi:hypothetical protein
MPNVIEVGDRVRIFLDSEFWESQGWFDGTVIRIDPYSSHRSFYWVELDAEVQDARGGRTSLVSILNPARITEA